MQQQKRIPAGFIAIFLAAVYCAMLICQAVQITPKSAEKSSGVSYTMDYPEILFDDSSVHTIQITIDDSQISDMTKNALLKELHICDVTIDGETVANAGIRTKGNSSLLHAICVDEARFSYMLEFDAFDGSQRYHGLEAISLNSNYIDTSYMRNHLALEMYREMGIASPLSAYAAVYLNGEYAGLYEMVEPYGEAFVIRNFGAEYGQLYKPEHFAASDILTGTSDSINGANIELLSEQGFSSTDIGELLQLIDWDTDDVALVYQWENLNDYDVIWDNAYFSIGKQDKTRVVNAIRNLNEGNYESALDTDEVLRYLAVSSFVLNADSYYTRMAHNYGLYEQDGLLSVLPWDNDVSLGICAAGVSTNNETEWFNLSIDIPVFDVSAEERPLVSILNNETYREKYYAYLDKILNDYVDNGRLNSRIDEREEMLRPWIDATSDSSLTDGRSEQSVEDLREFVSLRSESIRRQLNGDKTPVDTAAYTGADSLSSLSAIANGLDKIAPQINIGGIIQYGTITDWATLIKAAKPLIQEVKGTPVSNSIDLTTLKSAITVLLLQAVKTLLLPTLSVITIIAALIFVRRYGKGGRRHV